jgi:hypothetical protein
MQLVPPHWWNTCVWLIPIFTPPIEVPGTISFVFGLGNRARATLGQATHPIASTPTTIRRRPAKVRDIFGPSWCNIGRDDLVDRACESHTRQISRICQWGETCISARAICG